jgi:signal transduction histidine kinase
VSEANGYRVVSRALVDPLGQTVAYLQYGKPVEHLQQTLARIKLLLLLGVIGGAVLALLAGLALARRAISPIARLTEAAKTIARTRDPSVQIPKPAAEDEVADLARTLEEMLMALGQARTEQQAALDRQRRFVADASHELRTPVATIRAHVELLRGWASADPVAREQALASLDQAGRTAGRLVEDLLFLAQLDRLPTPPRAPTRLDQVVVDAVRDTQPLRPEVAIRVTRLDEALLLGDEQRLRQLLVNLFANGQRVTPHGGEVTVRLVADHASAELAVSDEGPGIAPEQLELIFERFHTADARRAGGAGLGLAIAREIAHRHGGEVRAANLPAGGAVFRVTLPLSA